MKFVFNYPETSGLESDLLDSGEISDVAVAVEAARFDAFALTEHPIPGANWLVHGGHQTLDPFVGLGSTCVAATRLGASSIGFDVDASYLDYAKKRLEEERSRLL